MKKYKANCDTCDIQSKNRMNKIDASQLCRLHNQHSEGCEAKPIPVCWVCFEEATYVNQKPPYEYVCDEHNVGIDYILI